MNLSLTDSTTLDAEARRWASRFTTLCAEATAAVRDLLALTAPLAEAAGREDPEAALSLIERRQPLIDRLTRLRPGIEAARQERERFAPALPSDARHALDIAAARLDALRQELAAAEDAALRALEAQRGNIADQMASLRQSKAASRAYGPGQAAPGERGPSFQDRRA